MGSVLELNSVRDTTLWKQLDSGFKGSTHSDTAHILAANLINITETAAQRIRLFPYYHPQYTLHDQTHMLRVCELMAMILGKSITSLNPIEIFLLICAAHYHDQGMIPEAAEWEKVKTSPDFKVSLQRWEIENPNLREIRQQLNDLRFSISERESLREKEQELLDAHRTEYLRHTHGERSQEIVDRLFGASEQMAVAGQNLSALVARLCVSHVWPSHQLSDQTGFRVDEAIGIHVVNLRYLAVVLRLADILDFDQDRTPNALLRTIHFASPISMGEWAKHRSVHGWEIGVKRVRFTMQCEHPAYQKAAYDFMDAIDHELADAHRIVHEFPRDTPNHYCLELPVRVD
jgi:hypothetical protein